MSLQGLWWHLKDSINCSQSQGAWLQHTQGVSPPQVLGVHRDLSLPLWNRWSSKVKILTPCPSWREKICLFQVGKLSFKCLINSVLFRWGHDKGLSGTCGNGCVLGQEHTLVTHRWHPSTQEGRCSAIIPCWLSGTKSNGEGPGKTSSLELFVWKAQHWTCCKGKGILHLLKEKRSSLLPFFQFLWVVWEAGHLFFFL